MKELLKKLLEKWSCSHDWELMEHIEVYDEFSTNIPAYHLNLYKCKKCGKFKKVKL